jgi:hypothetical protein
MGAEFHWKAFLVSDRLGQPWVSGHRRFLLRQVLGRGEPGIGRGEDERHLRAAAAWLAAAQDSQPDGGFSGRYRLRGGWSSSYPETTGYIVPTLLHLAGHLGDASWTERAARAIDFLLGLQLESGAFPGGEVAENRTAPSPFNTAQILTGLVAWGRETGDARTLDAARRASAWLCEVQDEDGAFRRHYYNNAPSTYSAHLSCWIAEYGVAMDDPAARAAAGRHLDWVLGHQDAATGWFDLAGFDEAQHARRIAYTHTIAYTIWGVLKIGLLLGREDAVAAAARAAEGVMRRLELSQRLPGLLDHAWKPVEQAQCLTGNCQMASIWFALTEATGDLRFGNAALKALDLVAWAQDLDNPNPGIRGGIAGSDPVWGSYIRMALPNWAAKFFIDALLERKRFLERLGTGPQ